MTDRSRYVRSIMKSCTGSFVPGHAPAICCDRGTRCFVMRIVKERIVTKQPPSYVTWISIQPTGTGHFPHVFTKNSKILPLARRTEIVCFLCTTNSFLLRVPRRLFPRRNINPFAKCGLLANGLTPGPEMPTDGEAIPRIKTTRQTRFQIPVLHPWYCLAIRGYELVRSR